MKYNPTKSKHFKFLPVQGQGHRNPRRGLRQSGKIEGVDRKARRAYIKAKKSASLRTWMEEVSHNIAVGKNKVPLAKAA